MSTKIPTVDRIREVLDYNPITGRFTNKIQRGRLRVGDILDSRNVDGYVQIVIDRTHYYWHRLAFLWMIGSCPDLIDHVDGDPGNNTWTNIRSSNKSTNAQNRTKQINNKCGAKGVSWRSDRSRYVARIKADGKIHHIGLYHTIEEAAAAYEAAAIRLHGEFHRV